MLEASLESYASASERLPETRCVCRDTDPPRHALTLSATDRSGLVLAALAVRNAVRPNCLGAVVFRRQVTKYSSAGHALTRERTSEVNRFSVHDL